ncbi:MAG: insulinase family protein [Defluviitaleaceae bacterium]|nr:insulinase family protein [Defluviitaleaceae bacterium]
MEIIKLKNGVRVVMEHMPTLRSVCLGIWIKTGSRYETRSINGVSHFTEHMLFKGTKKRSAKDIADEMDAIGAQMNAYTTKEYTCYYARTLDEHFEKSIDVLSDMFFNSVFDPEEIEKEKNVILEEINMYEDTPDEVANDIMQHNVWVGYPLSYSVLGIKKSVNSFSSQTFIDYLKKRYTPKNIVIAVAGSFNKDNTLELVKQYFEGHQSKEDASSPGATTYTKSIATKEKDIEQLNIQLGFPGISINDESIYAMGALNTFFGGGMSSVLYQSIREKRGLAYSVYSYNSAYEDVGLFTIHASLVKDNAKEVLATVFEEIEKMKKNKITSEQLSKTKDQLKSYYILSLESSSSRMSNIGRSLIMLNRVLTPDQIIQRIDDITIDDFYRVFEQVLDPKKASLSVVGPIQNMDFEEML